MPWVVDPGHLYSPLQQTLNNNLEQDESAFRRLYAFGIDAYRIIPHLGRLFMQNEQYEGETGLLKTTKDGHIQRQLTWTKFVNGTPQLLDTGIIH
jgi:Putative lipoprotein